MQSDKKRKLKKHKALATGLFFLMAAVYVLMVWLQNLDPQSWMGYVKAFSEAAMVGALADWFAVTALFKHPLGLPIPHTNLIERKKDDLGKNLGEFVKDNFLNPENIRPYIENLDAVKWISNWLEKPGSRQILEEETAGLIRKIVMDLKNEEVEEFLSEKGAELLQSQDYQKILSSGLNYLIEKNEDTKLLETVLPQIKEYIHESQGMIRQRISDNRPFIAFLAGKKISRELTDGLIAFVEEIQGDENHFVREKLRANLEHFAEEIKTSHQWEEKLNALKTELISAENLRPYAEDAWLSTKEILLKNLDDKESGLYTYLRKNIERLSHSLIHDEALGNRLNKWIRHFLYRLILRNREEAETLISSTVAGWEGKELSEKLELEVGKDLQFIRINGTLVGGLVGLCIYFLTHIFAH